MLEALRLTLESARHGNYCTLYEACPVEGVAINIDGYQARESMYTFVTPQLWGWRAAMASAMDVVATGARPVAVMASVGASDWDTVHAVMAGVREAARYMGAIEGKHDTNRSGPGEEWIDVAVLGVLEGPPIPRAPPSGRLALVQAGYAGYGLAETRLQGRPPGEVPPWLVKRKPPITAWRALQECGARAVMDNSDGLLYTVQVMAALGRLDIEVTEPPLVDPRLRVDPWSALDSWEDYNLLVLVPPSRADCLLDLLAREGVPARIIGAARPGGGRVTVRGRSVSAARGYERGLEP